LAKGKSNQRSFASSATSSCPLKKSVRAAEQGRDDVAATCEALRIAQPTLDPKRLTFIDETAATAKMTRLYGRAPQGERLVDKVPHGHWKTTTFNVGCGIMALPLHLCWITPRRSGPIAFRAAGVQQEIAIARMWREPRPQRAGDQQSADDVQPDCGPVHDEIVTDGGPSRCLSPPLLKSSRVNSEGRLEAESAAASGLWARSAFGRLSRRRSPPLSKGNGDQNV
jgi:hypothetical protein